MLKAGAKLAAALAPLAIAVTVYFEMKTEALRASINVTQQATAHETATSSAAFGELVERLELHEGAIGHLNEEVKVLRTQAERQGNLLLRHDERIALTLRSRPQTAPREVTSVIVHESESQPDMSPPAELPLDKLKRTKLGKVRPEPSEAAVRRVRTQIQQQIQEEP